MISPNSFWIRLADVLNDFDIFGVPFSLFPLSGESLFVLELPPASLDICKISVVNMDFRTTYFSKQNLFFDDISTKLQSKQGNLNYSFDLL